MIVKGLNAIGVSQAVDMEKTADYITTGIFDSIKTSVLCNNDSYIVSYNIKQDNNTTILNVALKAMYLDYSYTDTYTIQFANKDINNTVLGLYAGRIVINLKKKLQEFNTTRNKKITFRYNKYILSNTK